MLTQQPVVLNKVKFNELQKLDTFDRWFCHNIYLTWIVLCEQKAYNVFLLVNEVAHRILKQAGQTLSGRT